MRFYYWNCLQEMERGPWWLGMAISFRKTWYRTSYAPYGVLIMLLIGRQHDYLKTLTHTHVLACVHRHPDPFFCSEDFLNWLACLWTSELCFKGHQCDFDIAYVASWALLASIPLSEKYLGSCPRPLWVSFLADITACLLFLFPLCQVRILKVVNFVLTIKDPG